MEKAEYGFSLLELIVVVAIISVLVGISAPYYQEYLVETRQNVFRQNLATIRRVLEDFKGDHKRGPFRGVVYRMSPPMTYDCTFNSNLTCELTAGVVPPASTTYTDRRNKYLNALPIFEDPYTGEILPLRFDATGSIYFTDDGPGAHPGDSSGNGFDIDADAWYRNFDPNNINYESGSDQIGSGTSQMLIAAPNKYPADVTSVYVVDSRGIRY